ncbi:MAG: hypothetical protein AAB467_02685 [Patescibacteria group bacterium]
MIKNTTLDKSLETSLGTNLDKGKVALFGLAVLVLVFAVSTIYFYRQTSSLKQSSQQAVQQANQALIDKVGKLIVLPSGETPTIATVTDPARLKAEQPFFAHASLGDKVLIYTGARKAYMYNPTQNKIIEVAPINIGTPVAPTPAAASEATP